MDATKTQSTLDSFIKYVVQQSKSNLSKKDKNVSKQLYNSIAGKASAKKNSIEAYFEMESYGMFQDKGVKGKFSSAKAPNSPFKFGKSYGSGDGGLTNAIKKWVVNRRIQFREREGKGTKGQLLSYNQTAFLITRSIYAKGMKPTEFFSRPFELAFKKLPDELIEAYGLDVETFLKYTLKDNGKES